MMGKLFDREERDYYKVIVLVEDLSGKQKFFYILIYISILDENDNVFFFVNQFYDIVVFIDIKQGFVVIQVRN